MESEFHSGYAIVDPYYVWGEMTDFEWFLPHDGMAKYETKGPYFHIVIELENTDAMEFYRMVHENGADYCTDKGFYIPPIYGAINIGFQAARFLTMFANKEILWNLARPQSKQDCILKHIKRWDFCANIATGKQASPNEYKSPLEYYLQIKFNGGEEGLHFLSNLDIDWKGKKTPVLAVIDSNVSIKHIQWSGKIADRFIAIWDQDSATKNKFAQREWSDNFYGTVIDGENYKKYSESKHSELTQYIDERERFYKVFEHGSAVADIVFGFPKLNCCPDYTEVPIIVVDLPAGKYGSSDTSGRWLGAKVLDALRFAIDAADFRWFQTNFPLDEKEDKTGSIPPLYPLVANISFGYTAGGHRGQSVTCLAISELIQLRKQVTKNSDSLAVVFPAGNSYLDQLHQQIVFTARRNRHAVRWHIKPDDYSPNFLEIWFEHDDIDLFEISVIPPRKNKPLLKSTDCAQYLIREYKSGSASVAVIRPPSTSGNNLERNMALIVIAPAKNGGLPIEAYGTWEIQIHSKSDKESTIDFWVQRDDLYDDPARGARQSYLVCKDLLKYDESGRLNEGLDTGSAIKRENTMNEIATAKGVLVAGAARHSDKGIVNYSAASAFDDTNSITVATISERSYEAPYLIVSGSKPGSSAFFNGTSAAAAQLSRLIGEGYCKGKVCSFDGYIEDIVKNCGVPSDPNTLEHKRAGKGVIVKCPVGLGKTGL